MSFNLWVIGAIVIHQSYAREVKRKRTNDGAILEGVARSTGANIRQSFRQFDFVQPKGIRELCSSVLYFYLFFMLVFVVVLSYIEHHPQTMCSTHGLVR